MQRTWDEQHREFKKRRFLAMPMAAAIMWFVIGFGGAILPTHFAALLILVGVSGIYPLGLFISRFTGENLLNKSRPNNVFDRLCLYLLLMSAMTFFVAIPYFLVDPDSASLSVGILTGLIWIPFAWLIEHRIGILHVIARTVLVLISWYGFPELRPTLVPMVIVMTYMGTIFALELRWRDIRF